MKKILCIVITISGIYDTCKTMVQENHIVYHTNCGQYVEQKLLEVDLKSFENMSPRTFGQFEHVINIFNQLQNQHTKDRIENIPTIIKHRQSTIDAESKFLQGTEKDKDFLAECYDKLKYISEKTQNAFDNNLRTLFAKSEGTSYCRQLAETYKEIANSTQNSNDFLKSAFWFRMLFVTGEHSSYCNEYLNMLKKGKIL